MNGKGKGYGYGYCRKGKGTSRPMRPNVNAYAMDWWDYYGVQIEEDPGDVDDSPQALHALSHDGSHHPGRGMLDSGATDQCRAVSR